MLSRDVQKVGKVNYTLGECIKKIDVDGVAWCLWCQDKVSYGKKGKQHLVEHCSSVIKKN